MSSWHLRLVDVGEKDLAAKAGGFPEILFAEQTRRVSRVI